MLTANRLRERRANPPPRALNSPVPAAVPDPVEQAEKIRQLEVECARLRGSLVAMERRAVGAEARASSTNEELLKLSAARSKEPQPQAQQRGKR